MSGSNALQITDQNAGNALAQAPSWADAAQSVAGTVSSGVDALGQWLAAQRAKSAKMGLWNDATGLPTGAGLVNAAQQTGNALLMGTTAPGIRAFHGSPYDFERFDTSKIGTGEGAQAYGHGLYFAGNEGVARSYRDALTQKDFKTSTGESLPDWIGNSVKQVGDQFGTDSSLYGQTIDKHIADFQGRLAETQQGMATDPQPWMAESRIAGFNNIIDGLNKLKSGDATLQPRGSMYQVNIGADPDSMLQWDQTVGQHPAALRDKLLDMGYGDTDRGADVYSHLARGPNGDVGASQTLQQAGIPGISYLDAGSRGVGTGTKNHVVFDASTIDILRKYGIAGLIAGGGAAAAAGSQQPPTAQ